MQVDVTQADREAYLAMNMLPEFDAADVRAGLWDKVTGLQAFARHRIQAVRDQADEIARLREALDRQCDTMAFVLNKATLPDQWYCKFSNELEQDRAALQHKEPQS